MENGKEAIEKIEQLVGQKTDLNVIEIDGKKWSTRSFNRILFEPKPETLQVSTLTGFIDYIKANPDKLEGKSIMVLIDSYKRVKLISKLQGELLERAVYIEAVVDPELKTFQFDRYMSIESFIIALRSMFEPTEDVEKVIAYISKVRGGKGFTLDDDGVTQAATVSTGVSGALTKKESAPVILRLRPFRTFREIQQVESEFLFRMKLGDDGETVNCALFEADGGRWRSQAISAIYERLIIDLGTMGLDTIS